MLERERTMTVSRRDVIAQAGVAGLVAAIGLQHTQARAEEGRPVMLLQPVAGMPDAPDFTLPDLDGRNVVFSTYRGRPVLVNFWATWCPPCRAEIPSMERAWRNLRQADVAMLAIHVGGEADGIWAFLSEFNVTFPVLIDRSSHVSKSWQTIGLPTTYVTDPAGRKVLRAVGDREWDHPDLIARILALKA